MGLDHELVRRMEFTAPSGDKYACYLPGKGGKQAVADLEVIWFGDATKSKKEKEDTVADVANEGSGVQEHVQATEAEEGRGIGSEKVSAEGNTAGAVENIQEERDATARGHANARVGSVEEPGSPEFQEQLANQMDMLQSLRSMCFYKPNGYWTFEVCPGNRVRQFHLVTKSKRSPDFSLGTYHHTLVREAKSNATTEEIRADALLYFLMEEGIHIPDDDMDYNSLLRIVQREGLSEENALDAMDQLPAESQQQLYIGGQICHETASHRKTVVGFQCGSAQQKGVNAANNAVSLLGVISKIKETSTCQYIITITTPLACPSATEEEFDKMDQNTEEATPGSAIDILKKAKPQCYTHHGGWWTYETCLFGKFRQFHQDKNKNLVEENLLGQYTPPEPSLLAEEKEPGLVQDLDNPERSHLLLNYTGGSMCSITGKERTATLKVTCGDTLFITDIQEVSTCTYTATVQSPALCNHPAFWPKIEEPLKLHCWKEATQGLGNALLEREKEEESTISDSSKVDERSTRQVQVVDDHATAVAEENEKSSASDTTEL